MKFVVNSGGDHISTSLCEAAGLDPRQVRRIVLDLQAGHAALIYFETFADPVQLEVAFSAGLEVVSR